LRSACERLPLPSATFKGIDTEARFHCRTLHAHPRPVQNAAMYASHPARL
jgi:hypothetical protein